MTARVLSKIAKDRSLKYLTTVLMRLQQKFLDSISTSLSKENVATLFQFPSPFFLFFKSNWDKLFQVLSLINEQNLLGLKD